jgi:hypothetical protein
MRSPGPPYSPPSDDDMPPLRRVSAAEIRPASRAWDRWVGLSPESAQAVSEAGLFLPHNCPVNVLSALSLAWGVHGGTRAVEPRSWAHSTVRRARQGINADLINPRFVARSLGFRGDVLCSELPRKAPHTERDTMTAIVERIEREVGRG